MRRFGLKEAEGVAAGVGGVPDEEPVEGAEEAFLPLVLPVLEVRLLGSTTMWFFLLDLSKKFETWNNERDAHQLGDRDERRKGGTVRTCFLFRLSFVASVAIVLPSGCGSCDSASRSTRSLTW